jgi:predicted transcriptional regulator
MKKIPRRDKMKIYGDLLLILSTESTTEKKIVITKVQSRINVPYVRLKKYISDLKELDLIEDETSLKLTEKAKQYLEEYQNVLDFMKRMGMSYK